MSKSIFFIHYMLLIVSNFIWIFSEVISDRLTKILCMSYKTSNNEESLYHNFGQHFYEVVPMFESFIFSLCYVFVLEPCYLVRKIAYTTLLH